MKNLRWIGISVVLAVALNGGMRLLNIWLSPTGRVLDSTIFAVGVIQLVIAVVLAISIFRQASTGADLSDHWRMIYTSAAVFVVIALVSIPIGNLLARPIRQQGYEEFVQENQFLIDAIETYTADNGEPPQSLNDLYPTYLAEPLAEMTQEETTDGPQDKLLINASYNSIDANSADEVLYSFTEAEGSEPWKLQVAIYLGSFQSDRFVYNPEEQYSNRHTPVGRWGLISSQ